MAQTRVLAILRRLEQHYPDARCSLTHRNHFELLVATLLSAQCTDARVNQVTPALFQRYPTPALMSKARLSSLERLLASVNFYRTKAKALKKASQQLTERHQGEVPQQLAQLVELQGIGRKTANVVRGVGFQIPAMVVDTHIGRLSRRLGLTRSDEPEVIEQDLMRQIPEIAWVHWGLLLIDHGRAVCQARKPHCQNCCLAEFCPQILTQPAK